MVLSSNPVYPNIAVKDLAATRAFYEGKLGLTLVHGDDNEVVYASGDTKLLVYISQYAGTNQATAVTWHVGDIAGAITELKDKGISFEHYDMPGITMEGDVHVMGELKAAWFKDPDGNILALSNMAP